MAPYIDGVLKDWDDRLFPEVHGRRPKNIRGGRVGEKKTSPSTGPRKRLALTVQKVPEAVVKISGGGRNLGAIRAHLNYISRHGTLALEDESGALARGREENKEVLSGWSKSHVGIPEEGEHARQAFNIVLSMPPGTSRAGVREAARAFAALEFGANHQYVFVEHEDEAHPHVHLVVKAVGRDGVRLNPRKADLQRWREHFAGALRDQGILANATPRRARGVSRRGPKQALVHMRARGAVPARVPVPAAPEFSPPVLKSYREVQGALGSGDAADQALARQVGSFVGPDRKGAQVQVGSSREMSPDHPRRE